MEVQLPTKKNMEHMEPKVMKLDGSDDVPLHHFWWVIFRLKQPSICLGE